MLPKPIAKPTAAIRKPKGVLKVSCLIVFPLFCCEIYCPTTVTATVTALNRHEPSPSHSRTVRNADLQVHGFII